MNVYTVVRHTMSKDSVMLRSMKELCFSDLRAYPGVEPAIFAARKDAQDLVDELTALHPQEQYEVLASEVVPTMPEPTL